VIAPANDEVLSVRNLEVVLSRSDSEVALVRGVDLTLRAGQTTVLLGESGSGKSLSARALVKLTPHDMRVGGTVRLGQNDLVASSERELLPIRGARISLIPQDPSASLDPYHRVGTQMLEVLKIHRMGKGRGERRVRVMQMLAQVGLPDPVRVFKAWPHELSGGMKQRIAIAIGISGHPDLLIADEPTSALDVKVQAQILQLIRELQQELGMAVLFITHDVGVARDIADDVAVMYAGKVVEHGPAAEVLDTPAHPYTRALLAAIPKKGVERGELSPIAGEPPSPEDDQVTGCRFAPRCSDVRVECLAGEPSLRAVGDAVDHAAACVQVVERTRDAS
jgi:oligopeptide/dipeptide ABC transporter ATP-binding protein